MEKEYLSCAETAKLVRNALKKKFPGVKFSVRSDVYSGGASIDIGWILGPTTKEVDAVGKRFASASFDGSIDMETSWSHWLLPDGSAFIRSGPGTQGSMGYIPKIDETPMPEGAKPVHFGAHYVFAQRRYGQTGEDEMKLREQVARDMCKLQHIEYQNAYTTHLFGTSDTEQVDQHAWRLLNATSFAPGEVYDGVRYTEQGEDNGLSIPMVIIRKGGTDNGGNGIGRKMQNGL